jgi:hypothetical protein
VVNVNDCFERQRSECEIGELGNTQLRLVYSRQILPVSVQCYYLDGTVFSSNGEERKRPRRGPRFTLELVRSAEK